MRLTKHIIPVFLFSFVFMQFFSCSVSQKALSQEELIIGKWVLESASFEGKVVKAEVLGGKISFEFTKEGFATFQTSEGQLERGRYQIQSNKLFDPDSPEETPADIVSLTREHLIMAMEESGDRVTMRFIPEPR